jgi:hypothetical protein
MRHKPILKPAALRFLLLVLIGGAALSSCGGQPTGEPTVDVNAIMTSGVGTFVAALTQTAAAQPSLTSTATPTITSSPIILNTPTLQPTNTQAFVQILPTTIKLPTVTGTQYTPTANPGSLAVGCNNLRLVQDVNIPAGTVVKPGEGFTKTWKVENNGTCDWVYLYRLVFVSGDRMGGEPASLGKVIVPGKWTQLSIGFAAPNKAGTYTGYWRMGTQAGSPFGATLTVSIIVGTPTNTPQPTATSTSTSTPTSSPPPTTYP